MESNIILTQPAKSLICLLKHLTLRLDVRIGSWNQETEFVRANTSVWT
jgi:hypothetical protein